MTHEELYDSAKQTKPTVYVPSKKERFVRPTTSFSS